MSDNIPFEIQAEIIKRLPAKPFIQCKSLSKSWKSLIETPEFIADYNNCQAKRHRLLVRWYDAEQIVHLPDPKYISVVDDDTFPKHKFTTTFPSCMPYLLVNRLKLIGSSQGLLCLFGDYRDENDMYREIAFIWNPSIKKTISIDIDFPPCHDEIYTNILGFGVPPNTSDPMLVKFDNIDGLFDFTWNVEILTSSSGEWKPPRGKKPRKSTLFMSQIAIGSFIYFICESEERCLKLIVSFDMTSEDFTEINLPNNLAHWDFRSVSISKLKESLVVLEYDNEGEKPVCAVWAMKHGVPNFFTKLFTINTPDSIINKVLEFTQNGEPIMERKVHEDGEPAALVVYEQSSDSVKDLGIYGETGSFFVSSYTETLLLLGHSD